MSESGSFGNTFFCARVLRRRLAADLVDLMFDLLLATRTGGWSLSWSRNETDTAYRMAQGRLRKKGLVAYRRTGGKSPVLILTEEGEHAASPALKPETYWGRKWNGIWYVLLYDVPESERRYRDVLRPFLKRMRMGPLQKSVWISPDDIRPDFEDLKTASGIDDYACLLACRTVLGLTGRQLADRAWNWTRLQRATAWYFSCREKWLRSLESRPPDGASVMAVMREELSSYLSVMAEDPLLPRVLWPPDYTGPELLKAHRAFVASMAARLS